MTEDKHLFRIQHRPRSILAHLKQILYNNKVPHQEESALDLATIAMIVRGLVLTPVFMGNTSHSTGAIASEDVRFF